MSVGSAVNVFAMPRQIRSVFLEIRITAWIIRWTVNPLFDIRIRDTCTVVGSKSEVSDIRVRCHERLRIMTLNETIDRISVRKQ